MVAMMMMVIVMMPPIVPLVNVPAIPVALPHVIAVHPIMATIPMTRHPDIIPTPVPEMRRPLIIWPVANFNRQTQSIRRCHKGTYAHQSRQ